MTLAGIRVRDLVAQEGLNLCSYKEDTKGCQWASQMEVYQTATALGICIFVGMGHYVFKIGRSILHTW